MLDLFDEALKGADDGEDMDAITPSGMAVVARRLQVVTALIAVTPSGMAVVARRLQVVTL